MATYLPAEVNPPLLERALSGLHEALIQKLPTLDPATPVLDLGCGTGAWLERLAAHGFQNLHGVDLETIQFQSKRATYSQANLDFDSDLGIAAQKFGLITAIELIEHLENPGRFFYHVSQYLTEDGYFLMTTPNIHSVLCRFRFLMTGKLKQFDDKGDPTHIYPVLLAALERILPRYGLEIVRKWPFPPDGGSVTSRWELKLMSAILGKLLPDNDPGDILCLLIRKKGTA